MSTQSEYERDEARRLQAQLDAVERAPLAERREGMQDWTNAMQCPHVIGERVEWIFNGTYGFGAMKHAERIRDGRGNREAQLGMLVAALDHNCPRAFAAKAWKGLPAGLQRKVNAAIARAIKASRKGDA